MWMTDNIILGIPFLVTFPILTLQRSSLQKPNSRKTAITFIYFHFIHLIITEKQNRIKISKWTSTFLPFLQKLLDSSNWQLQHTALRNLIRVAADAVIQPFQYLCVKFLKHQFTELEIVPKQFNFTSSSLWKILFCILLLF